MHDKPTGPARPLREAARSVREFPAAVRAETAARHVQAVSEALDATRAYLERFVAFPSAEAADAATLYTAYTHIADRFDIAPRLLIEAAEHGCGKSTLRKAIQHASARSLSMSRATGAAMYHSLGDYDAGSPRGWCPTLFLDEMDTLPASVLAELSGVVNAGFESGEPVRRASGTDVVAYSTFGPAVIVGIEVKLAESTLSRSIRIIMRRAGAGVLDRPKRIAAAGAEMRVALARMAMHVPAGIGDADAEPGPLSYRTLDKWEPLLLLAAEAGPGWAVRAYAAAVALEPQTTARDLLADIACLLGRPEYDVPFIASSRLLSGLLTGLGHDDWHEAGLNLTGLGRKLAAYDVRPVQQSTGSRARGYRRADLDAALAAFRPAGVA